MFDENNNDPIDYGMGPDDFQQDDDLDDAAAAGAFDAADGSNPDDKKGEKSEDMELNIKETDYANSDSKRKKTDKRQLDKTTSGEGKKSDLKGKNVIRVVAAAAVTMAAADAVRTRKLQSCKAQVEKLNSKKTTLNNTHANDIGSSVQKIMIELKLKEIQRKTEKLQKRVTKSKTMAKRMFDGFTAIGRISGRRGMAQVMSEGSTKGAKATDMPTIGKAKSRKEVPSVQAAEETTEPAFA